MPFDTRRAHRAAATFIASGSLLGAILGWTYDKMRTRRTGG